MTQLYVTGCNWTTSFPEGSSDLEWHYLF